jgi:hypothetical protein
MAEQLRDRRVAGKESTDRTQRSTYGPPSDRLEKIHPAAINYAWEEALTVLTDVILFY